MSKTEPGPSQTAQLAAAHRAYHFSHAHPPILEDSAAIWLLGPPLSTVLRVAPLRWLFWRPLLAKVRPISAFIVVRSRYVEDCLAQSVSNGCQQYVILGAGLDSWALRHETSNVSVFELDQPGTQQWKEARIREKRGSVPPNLTLIPIDFEHEAIADVLGRQQYGRNSTAFVSWLGTIYYLTHEAIEATFASLAEVCTSGSRIVFDYFQPKSTMSPDDLQLFETLDSGGTARGEPLKTLFDPDEMARLLRTAGFHVIEDLSASEIRQRYLHGRSDGLDIPGFVRLCQAERAHLNA